MIRPPQPPIPDGVLNIPYRRKWAFRATRKSGLRLCVVLAALMFGGSSQRLKVSADEPEC